MATKRKAAALADADAEASQNPVPVQPEPEDIQQAPKEDPLAGEEKEDSKGEENENPDNMEENGGDAVKNDREIGFSENPSETSAVPDNGGEEGDDEDEPLEKVLEPFSKDQLTLLVKEAAAKHPDLIEIANKLADSDPAHRRIFIHGLGWESNDETVTSSFTKYGEVEDCKVVKDKVTGKSKGYAFLLFKRRSGARRALKEPQKSIDGRMASCQMASDGPVRSPTAAAVPASNESEYTRRKIYVTNVSADLDPTKLSEFFSTFGEIEDGPLGLDKQTGKPRGFCLFVYKSIASAQKALQEPHKTFEGHTLHCQKAVDGPKHTKTGFFNQQQGNQARNHLGNKGNFHHSAKKGKYSGGGEVGHMMGSAGYNPTVAPVAIGQAVAALLATRGPGLGIGNLLGGGVNHHGLPPMMNNAGYGAQPMLQGGYGGQPPMGRGGVRPHQGGGVGGPYMGPR